MILQLSIALNYIFDRIKKHKGVPGVELGTCCVEDETISAEPRMCWLASVFSIDGEIGIKPATHGLFPSLCCWI